MNKYAQKLNRMLKVSGLSQEDLARRLDVSFPTLNSWVNSKSEPREKSRVQIDQLFVEFFGADSITKEELSVTKKIALSKKVSIKKILENLNLLDKITVNLTYHTNTIEGSTMTERDVKAVLLENKIIKNRTAIEQRETINHQTALNFLLDELNEKGKNFKIDKSLIINTHLRLMNGIISDAGNFRNHSVRIVGSKVPLVNFIKIPSMIEKWCNKINEETTDPINLLAVTHSEFEQIHPFSDGNGRTGRLLLFIKALHFGLIPPIIQKEKKQAYYKYLEICQIEESSDLLENFISEAIINSSNLLEEK